MPGGLHPPPEVIFSWPEPNYVNPETRSWAIPITTIVLGSLGLLTLILRLWSRVSFTRNVGVDDWFLVAGMVFTTLLTVALTLASQVFYFNRHVWDIPIPELYKTRIITLIIEVLYTISVGLIKISVLLFYWRLTSGILPRVFAHILWLCIGLVVAFIIVFTIFPFVQCRPFIAFFYQVDPTWYPVHPYHCISDLSNIYIASIISMLQDFLVALLPTVFFFRLKIPLRQKIALVSVFAVGFFLCAAAIVRMIYVWKIFNDTYDVTWMSWEGWLWTNIEVCLGIVVASAPALKVFFRSLLDGAYGSYYTDDKKSRDPTSTYDSVSANKSRFSFRRLSRRFSNTPGDPNLEMGIPQTYDANTPSQGFALPLRNLSEENVEQIEEHSDNKDHRWMASAGQTPLADARWNFLEESPRASQDERPSGGSRDEEDVESQYTLTTTAERQREVKDLGREIALGRIGRLHLENDRDVGRAM